MMKLSRYIASAAVIVVALSTSSCAADNQQTAPYLDGATPNIISPARGPIAGISSSGTSCASGLTVIQLSANDAHTSEDTGFVTTQLDNMTIVVANSDGFESVVAGIVTTEDETRVPFSTNADGFRQDERSFIALPVDFGAKTIIGITLCVGRG